MPSCLQRLLQRVGDLLVLIVAVGEKDGQRLRFVAQETVAARAERRELTMEGDGRETGGRREEERGGKGGEGTNRKAEKDRGGLWGSNDGQCVLLERVCVWYVLWCAGRVWRGVCAGVRGGSFDTCYQRASTCNRRLPPCLRPIVQQVKVCV